MTMFSALVSSFKTATDLTKLAVDVRDQAKLQATMIELQGAILSAQNAAFALQVALGASAEQLKAAEKEIDRFKNWTKEKERYRLTQYPAGTYAYELKPDRANDEPIHRLCSTCFQHERKSFLHTKRKHEHGECAECLVCKTELQIIPWSTPIMTVGARDYDPYNRF